jgi:hypothetical protein
MAVLITVHDPIRVVQTISGNAEDQQSYLEHVGETFLGGTPVELSSGLVIPWDGSTITGAILGITALAGQNLGGASNTTAPPTFGSIGFPGGSPTIPPHPPNQLNAVNLGDGTPFITGQTLVSKAVPDSIFRFQVDNSSGSTYNATTALIGTQLGLTVDANGSWYADLGKSTPGNNTVLLVVGLDPLDFVAGSNTTQINNGHVFAVFLQAATSVQN